MKPIENRGPSRASLSAYESIAEKTGLSMEHIMDLASKDNLRSLFGNDGKLLGVQTATMRNHAEDHRSNPHLALLHLRRMKWSWEQPTSGRAALIEIMGKRYPEWEV